MTIEYHWGEEPECHWGSWVFNFRKWKIKWGWRAEKQILYLIPHLAMSWPPGIFGVSIALAVLSFSVIVFNKEKLGMVS